MPKIEYIKDGKGQIIGQQRGNLIQRNGAIIGQFDKGNNITRTVAGKIVGYGDQRIKLLGEKTKKKA